MKRFAVILLCLCSLSLCAQRSKKMERAYEAARTAFIAKDYKKASQQINKVLEANDKDAEAWLLQGEIGMETKDFALAMLSYEHSLAADSLFFPPVAITLSSLYDGEMRYSDEIRLLRWFQNTAPGNKVYDEKAADMLQNAMFRKEAVLHPVEFQPENLGEAVNTPNDEYINALELTGTEMLFTRRFSATPDRIQDEALFFAHAADGQWYPATQLRIDPEMDNHVGAAFLSYKGDALYFTVCGMERHNQGCDLYVAYRDSIHSPWSGPVNLGGTVNDAAWDSQPCLSLKGDELFFASRREGNADIYHCLLNEDGTWGEPENLGPVINTTGREMAPFIHPDGKTLYFSSDKHVGMGGYDLFMSRRNEQGEWSEPVNLGYPINTPGDEINFIVAADGHTALISSARESGFGGYDIYAFQMKEDETKPEPMNVYDYLVEDLAVGTIVSLVNIKFEYNSAALTEDSQEGIDMLATFLENHPEITVELAGHTDDMGSDTYNLKLSNERAGVVLQALVERGIAAERLVAKGYGSSKPLYPNDTEEHRAMNRRTEMIIN